MNTIIEKVNKVIQKAKEGRDKSIKQSQNEKEKRKNLLADITRDLYHDTEMKQVDRARLLDLCSECLQFQDSETLLRNISTIKVFLEIEQG